MMYTWDVGNFVVFHQTARTSYITITLKEICMFMFMFCGMKYFLGNFSMKNAISMHSTSHFKSEK